MSTSLKKSEKPRIAIFLAQPGGALVGEGKKFPTHWDLCRGLHGLGAEAVTLPCCKPYVDLAQASDPKKGEAYCRTLLTQYEDCGTPAIRFEAHVPGNMSLLHSSRIPRFASFALADLARTVAAYEAAGQQGMEQSIIASAHCGFPNLVAFSGGRGYQAAQYPWPAYPQNFQATVLALLIVKHRANLLRAAQAGINVGFELHPEEDLHSPRLLHKMYEFMKVVAPEAAKALAANGDASHETLMNGDAVDHMQFLFKHGFLRMIHAKDGKVLPCPGGSMAGDFSPRWSNSRRRFQTFGTGDADWKKILPIWSKAHKDLPHGLDLVGELECSKYPDMWEGAELTIRNLLNARDGKDLENFEDVIPRQSDNDWESFCSGADTAAQLLELTGDESLEVGRILQMVGV